MEWKKKITRMPVGKQHCKQGCLNLKGILGLKFGIYNDKYNRHPYFKQV